MKDSEFEDERVSPFVLKMITDSSIKYQKAYRSYAFGLKQKLMGKWMWVLIGVIALVVVFMFLTGRL